MGWVTELGKSPQKESEFMKGYLSEYDRGYQDGGRETAEKIFAELFYMASIHHSDIANILAWAKDKAKQLGVEIKG